MPSACPQISSRKSATGSGATSITNRRPQDITRSTDKEITEREAIALCRTALLIIVSSHYIGTISLNTVEGVVAGRHSVHSQNHVDLIPPRNRAGIASRGGKSSIHIESGGQGHRYGCNTGRCHCPQCSAGVDHISGLEPVPTVHTVLGDPHLTIRGDEGLHGGTCSDRSRQRH